MADKEFVMAELDKFLSSPKPTVSSSGWPNIKSCDFIALYELFYAIVDAKWGTDCDGDSPVQVRVVDRNTHKLMHYQPVPYQDFCADNFASDKVLRAVALNSELAATDLRNVMQQWQHYRAEQDKKDKADV